MIINFNNQVFKLSGCDRDLFGCGLFSATPFYFVALEMNLYRYYVTLLLSFLFPTAIWPVTGEQSNTSPQKEKLKNIPNIPELSPQ